jgi:hypothetical protein
MPNTNLEEVRESIKRTQLAVIPNSTSPAPSRSGGGSKDPDLNPVTTFAQSEGKAVQSIGQTTAIVIQDAADMLRNISTIEVTAIGAATAAWLADPANAAYETIINEATTVIQNAAAAYLLIGQNAYTVFKQFD